MTILDETIEGLGLSEDGERIIKKTLGFPELPAKGKAILVKNRCDSVYDWELRFSLEKIVDGKLLACLFLSHVRSGKSEVAWEQWRDLEDGMIPRDLMA